MSIGFETVVVVVDAAREISLSTIGGALQGLTLKAGDKFIVVGAIHQLTNPMGYISKVALKSILSVSPKFVDEELIKKKEEYLRDRINKASMHCKMRKIEFQIEVQVGPSLKLIAVAAAKSFGATWLIIDRQLKREKKYLMEKLPCGIARVKSNNQIEQIRDGGSPAAAIQASRRSVGRRARAPIPLISNSITYGEMVEGSSEEEEEVSSRKSYSKSGFVDTEAAPPPPSPWSGHGICKSSSSDYLTTPRISTSCLGYTDNSSISTRSESKSSSASYLADRETSSANTDRETTDDNRYSPSSGPYPAVTRSSDWNGIAPSDEVFQNSVCSICNNRRPKVGLIRQFTFTELQSATNNFSSDNFLSKGGFGSVYSGELGVLKFAVKHHNSASFQGEKEFTSEVDVLSKARHENLVMLLGSCSEKNQRLLVYEFVCNGSLDQHLADDAKPLLTWEKRMKIALGAAKGLQYLHQNNIIHRDFRPNNILVTHDFETMLGDFGLAKTQLEDSDNSADQTRVVGTLGYLAPEYAEFGKVSSKTDVYAFGVVLLQLITGKKTTDEKLGGRSLVGWARPLLKERNYPDLIDPRIVDSHDVHQLFWMVRVAEKCLSKDPHKRLPMNTVVLALSCVLEGKSVSSIKDFSPAHSSGSVGEGELTDSPCDDNEDDMTCRRTHYCTRKRVLPPSPVSMAVQHPTCSAPEEIDEDYYFDYII